MFYKDISKMVLGTVQMGSDYGIANRSGKPSTSESMRILETAWDGGIRNFDTAPGYNSETILGQFIKTQGIENEAKVLTKISSLGNDNEWQSSIRKSIVKSLSDIGVSSIKVLFFHNAKDSVLLLKEPQFFRDLLTNYPITSLGVSVYEPEEIQRLEGNCFDLAFQFPYNILDRRFENNTVSVGKRYGRSVFLQGLLAAKHLKDNAPRELKQIHSKIQKFCSERNISSVSQAIQFVVNSKSIDFFLLGVDNVEQLEQILSIDLEANVYCSILEPLNLSISDRWLDPRQWR
jgi:aryl-alcohol dehydrogenase-like predicted oxidoreductase